MRFLARTARPLAAAALLALAATAPAGAAGLRLALPLESDPYVTWSSDLGGLDLAVRLPEFDPASETPEGFGRFDLAGLREASDELRALGELPARWVRLPLPDEGELALEVFELHFRDGSVVGLGPSQGHGRHRSPGLEGDFAPAEPLALEGVGFDGGRRFAYLRLMPWLRSLDGGEDLVLESARARLHVGPGTGAPSLDPGAGPGFSRGQLGPAALPRAGGAEPEDAPPTAAVRARLLVDATGLQLVPRAALERAAPELLRVEPERLRLRRDGREVSRRLVLDGAGELERLEFVGSPRLGENEAGVFQAGDFTDTEVYFLEAAPEGESGRTLERRGAAPAGEREELPSLVATARLEENSFFYNTVAATDLDHWAWGRQLRSDGSAPATLAIPLALPGLDVAGDRPVSFRVLWHGRGADELERPHRTEIHLGGELLSRADWEGFRVLSQQAESTSSAVATAGELVVAVPGLPGTGVDGASLDHVLVSYRRLPVAEDDLLDARLPDGSSRLRVSGFSDAAAVRAFELLNADAPVELTGLATEGDAVTLDLDAGRLGGLVRLVGPGALREPVVERSAPEDLLAPEQGADWVAVVPEALAGSALLDELVEARRAGGWTPRRVSLQDAFDLFSFGRPDPRAVPRLLEHAIERWPAPRPQVLLLVGDGSQDYKGRMDAGGSLVPAQLFSDPAERTVIGHHAGDSRAAAVAGLDVLPEAAVGRIPARSLGELDAALAKILAAETPAPGDWRRRVLLAADDARPSDGFGVLADALAARTPSPHAVARIGGAAMLRDELPELLGDGGAAVLLYAGNGGIDRWSPPGAFGAPYLAPHEVPELQPGGPWPVVVDGGSLLTGAYHHEAEVPALQEVLLLAEGAGSAGGIAPSGDLDALQGRALLEAAHEALFGLDRVRTLGELAERVRRRLDELGGPRAPQAVAGLVTFGDPAMPLALPVPPRPPWLSARGTDAEIVLSWAAPPEAPAGATYRLYRAEEAAGPFAPVADGLDVPGWVDASVAPGPTYHYRVTLVDAEGFESPASNRAAGRVGDDGEVVVFGCLPDSGRVGGGQVVRIVGRGFQPGGVGFLDGEECLASTWLDLETLECVTPGAAHPGLVAAAVVNPDTSRGDRPRAYAYCPDRTRLVPGESLHDAPSPVLASRSEVEALRQAGELVVVLGDDGTRRLLDAPVRERPFAPPLTRRPDQPRPDSFEPVIDPGLSRIIRFPRPDCGR